MTVFSGTSMQRNKPEVYPVAQFFQIYRHGFKDHLCGSVFIGYIFAFLLDLIQDGVRLPMVDFISDIIGIVFQQEVNRQLIQFYFVRTAGQEQRDRFIFIRA